MSNVCKLYLCPSALRLLSNVDDCIPGGRVAFEALGSLHVGVFLLWPAARRSFVPVGGLAFGDG